MSNQTPPNDWRSSLAGRLDRLLNPVEDTANMLAALAILLLMLLGSAQIILRTVFNSPIAGYIDLVELSMAGMAFLGVAYCQRLGAHIRMEFLVSHLKGRWLWATEVIATLVALTIVAILTWYAWGHFLRAYELGDTTIDAEFLVWPSKLLVPLAFGLWFLRLSVQLAGYLRLIIDPSRTPAGVVEIQDHAAHARDEIEEALGESVSDLSPSGSQETRP